MNVGRPVKTVYLFDTNGKPAGSHPSVREASDKLKIKIGAIRYHIKETTMRDGIYFSYEEKFYTRPVNLK